MTCAERHPTRGEPCVVERPDHTWHRAESRAIYRATDVWPWGEPEQPADTRALRGPVIER